MHCIRPPSLSLNLSKLPLRSESNSDKLSVLKIQSEGTLSRVSRFDIESMCVGWTGCDLNGERPNLIEIEKPSDIDRDNAAY